ncbi:MAG: UvrD-helicase domain-containing protein [Chlamydiota bacterium]
MKTQFNCLNRNTPITGNHFLEASAGTGKTFAIEHIVARLLLEKETFSIQNILVVTFTKAAVRDLRLRIRNNLEVVFRFLREENETPFDYLIPFLEKEKRNKALVKIEEALFFFDQNQIFTIHAFCYRMLQEGFLEAKISSEFQEKKEKKTQLQEKLLDLLRFQLPPDIISPSQWKILQKKEKEEASLINKFLSFTPPSLKISSFIDHWTTFLERLPLIPHIDSIEESFHQLFPYFKISNFSKDTLLSEIQIFSKILQNKKLSLDDLDSLLETGLSFVDFFSETNKKQKAPKDLQFPHLASIKKHIFPIIEEASNPKKILQVIGNHIFQKLESFMEEEELFSHDYLLQKMKKTLQEKPFCQKIQEKYHAVIVDEFQDTDPIQWKIFDTLFIKNSTLESFFLVGDPKQSIYSFRKADLATYFQAEKTFGSTAKKYLDQNFRSSPSLVQSLNHFFSEPFAPPWLQLPKEQQKLPYLPIRAGIQEDFSFQDTKAPIHFLCSEDSLIGTKWPTDRIKQKILFPYIVEEINRLHTKNAFGFSQIAVLVKDRYEQQALQDFFSQHHIPFSSKEHALLTESYAFQSLIELFEGILFCHDVSKVKKAFLGPFFEGTVATFSLEILSFFCEFRNSLFLEDFYTFLHKLFSFSWENIPILDRILQREDFSLYQDTQRIKELLLEYMKEKKRSPEMILSFFSELPTKDPEEEERIKKSFSSNEEGVQIITMHMSKGLEFEIVFALGVGSRTPSDEDNEEGDKEKFRQLYVALTRAKKRVYIPFCVDNRKKSLKPGTISPIELFISSLCAPLQNPYEALQDLFLEKILLLLNKPPFFSTEVLQEKEIQQTPIAKEPLILIPPPPQKPLIIKKGIISSFSTLSSSLEEKTVHERKPMISKPTLPLGAETGIFFHSLFENIFRSSLSEFSKNRIEEIITEIIAIHSMTEYKEEIQKIVFSTFSTPLVPHNFCLQDLDFTQARPEVEFFFEDQNDHFLKGFIDLLFYHQGKYYLLDWKTNYLGDDIGKNPKEKILSLMQEENYFLQSSIYTENLYRLLGSSLDHFGGMFYIFLREIAGGNGIFHFFPSPYSKEPHHRN